MNINIEVKYIGAEYVNVYEYRSLNQAIKRIEAIYDPMSGVRSAKIEFDLELGGKNHVLEYAPFVVPVNWRGIETLLTMLLHMESAV